MTQDLGFYTGWAVALVLMFLLPLMVVFIEYLRRVNRKLRNIQSRLVSLSEQKNSIKENRRESNTKHPLPRLRDGS